MWRRTKTKRSGLKLFVKNALYWINFQNCLLSSSRAPTEMSSGGTPGRCLRYALKRRKEVTRTKLGRLSFSIITNTRIQNSNDTKHPIDGYIELFQFVHFFGVSLFGSLLHCHFVDTIESPETLSRSGFQVLIHISHSQWHLTPNPKIPFADGGVLCFCG